MVVTNRTKCLRSRQIGKKFWVAQTKQSEYYVFLGSRKQAVPPAAEIVASVNSKPKFHYFETPSAVSAVRACSDERGKGLICIGERGGVLCSSCLNEQSRPSTND